MKLLSLNTAQNVYGILLIEEAKKSVHKDCNARIENGIDTHCLNYTCSNYALCYNLQELQINLASKVK